MALILASGSPRRRDIMTAAGYDFRVVMADVEEDAPSSLGPQKMCAENARQKVEAVVPLVDTDDVVVGADTLVFLDGVPLGKPHTPERAREMLGALSGRENVVCTGVAVAAQGRCETFAVESRVQFKELDDAIISAYMAAVDTLDKAGAYAVQSEREMIIESVTGDMNSVIGLPMDDLAEVLARFGVVAG